MRIKHKKWIAIISGFILIVTFVVAGVSGIGDNPLVSINEASSQEGADTEVDAPGESSQGGADTEVDAPGESSQGGAGAEVGAPKEPIGWMGVYDYKKEIYPNTDTEAERKRYSVLYEDDKYSLVIQAINDDGYSEQSDPAYIWSKGAKLPATVNDGLGGTGGYTFRGWHYYDPTNEEIGEEITNGNLAIMSDTAHLHDEEGVTLPVVDIIEVWSNEYKVTLNNSGEGTISPNTITVTHGKTYHEALNSVTVTPAQGRKLVGWSSTAGSTTADITDSTVVNKEEDHTLYAVWADAAYDLTFDYNYEGAPSRKVVKGDTNSTYEQVMQTNSIPTSPTREGYECIGWYTEPTNGEKIDITQKVSADKKNLYAHWQENTYSISYQIDGKTDSSLTPNSYSYTTASVTLPTPTKSGHVFYGWYKNSDYSGDAITKYTPGNEKGNVTFYGRYVTEAQNQLYNKVKGFENGKSSMTELEIFNTEVEIVVEYDNNKASDKNFTIGEDYDNKIEGYRRDVETKNRTSSVDGLTLSGIDKWFVKLAVKKVQSSDTVFTDLKGQIDADVLGVLYNINLQDVRSADDRGNYLTYTLQSGEKATISIPVGVFDTNGYDNIRLVYQDPNTKEIKDLSHIIQDGCYVVQLSSMGLVGIVADVPYDLSFNYNYDGAPSSATVGWDHFEKTDTYEKIMNANHIPTSPTREGYTFEGWYTDATYGTKVEITETVSSDKKNLYAHWQENTYSISYQIDGETYNGSPNSYKYTTESVPLPKPTKSGYVFHGWYTNSDYSGDAITEYTPGNEKGDITFYGRYVTEAQDQLYKKVKKFEDDKKNSSLTELEIFNTEVEIIVEYDNNKASDKNFTIGEDYDNKIEEYRRDIETKNRTSSVDGNDLTLSGISEWFVKLDVKKVQESDTAFTNLRKQVDADVLGILYNINFLDVRSTDTQGHYPTYTLQSGEKATISIPVGVFDTNGYDNIRLVYQDPETNAIKYFDASIQGGYYSIELSSMGLVGIVADVPYDLSFNYNYDGSPPKVTVGWDHFEKTDTYEKVMQAKGIPTSPTRTGYEFIGWYTDATYGTKVEITETVSSSKKDLYAHWRENTYSISYQIDGKTYSTSPNSYKYTTKSVPLPKPTKSGYVFHGWYTNPDYSGDAITEYIPPESNKGNVTFYGRYVTKEQDELYNKVKDFEKNKDSMNASDKFNTEVEIIVEYDNNKKENEEFTIGEDYDNKIEGYRSDVETKNRTSSVDGLKLSGINKWFVKLDVYKFTNEDTDFKDLEKKIDANVLGVLYDINLKDVRSAENPDDYSTYTLESGEKATIKIPKGVFNTEGYENIHLIYQNPDTKEIKNLSHRIQDGYYVVELSSMGLVGIVADVPYDLSFNYNYDGAPSSATVGWDHFEKTDTYEKIMNANGIPTNPTRTGYEFIGWFTGPTNGTEIKITERVSLDKKDLYAHWRENTYSIEYVIDDEPYNGNPSYYSYTAESVTLPTPTKSGHVFYGWYTNSDYSGDAIDEYIPGNEKQDVKFYGKYLTIDQDELYNRVVEFESQSSSMDPLEEFNTKVSIVVDYEQKLDKNPDFTIGEYYDNIIKDYREDIERSNHNSSVDGLILSGIDKWFVRLSVEKLSESDNTFHDISNRVDADVLGVLYDINLLNVSSVVDQGDWTIYDLEAGEAAIIKIPQDVFDASGYENIRLIHQDSKTSEIENLDYEIQNGYYVIELSSFSPVGIIADIIEQPAPGSADDGSGMDTDADAPGGHDNVTGGYTQTGDSLPIFEIAIFAIAGAAILLVIIVKRKGFTR